MWLTAENRSLSRKSQEARENNKLLAEKYKQQYESAKNMVLIWNYKRTIITTDKARNASIGFVVLDLAQSSYTVPTAKNAVEFITKTA